MSFSRVIPASSAKLLGFTARHLFIGTRSLLLFDLLVAKFFCAAARALPADSLVFNTVHDFRFYDAAIMCLSSLEPTHCSTISTSLILCWI